MFRAFADELESYGVADLYGTSTYYLKTIHDTFTNTDVFAASNVMVMSKIIFHVRDGVIIYSTTANIMDDMNTALNTANTVNMPDRSKMAMDLDLNKLLVADEKGLTVFDIKTDIGPGRLVWAAGLEIAVHGQKATIAVGKIHILVPLEGGKIMILQKANIY